MSDPTCILRAAGSSLANVHELRTSPSAHNAFLDALQPQLPPELAPILDTYRAQLVELPQDLDVLAEPEPTVAPESSTDPEPGQDQAPSPEPQPEALLDTPGAEIGPDQPDTTH